MTTTTSLPYGGPADSDITLTVLDEWVDRVGALAAHLIFGEHYSRPIAWNLREMSRLTELGYIELAEQHLIGAEGITR